MKTNRKHISKLKTNLNKIEKEFFNIRKKILKFTDMRCARIAPERYIRDRKELIQMLVSLRMELGFFCDSFKTLMMRRSSMKNNARVRGKDE